MPDDSSLRIEIALRASLIAKAALEMVNMDPRLAVLQVREVEIQIAELKQKLRK